MSGWIVYSKDGNIERCRLKALEYGGTAMGERAVTATFDYHSEVAFEVFDYIEYRGERFELESIPTVKKLSSFEYQYELRFVSLKYELERCEMRDLVPSDNGVVYPTPLTFSFTGDVRYLTDRIQACLDAMYGKGVWNIVISDGTKSEEKNISIAQQNCWNALALVNSTYGLSFYIKGRTITIGGEQPLVNHTFEYGKGNGLYEIERASDTGTGIVTKLRAYGSTRNLDYSYPKKPEWSDSVLPVSFALSPLRLMLPSFKKDGKTDYVLADDAAIARYGIREASMVYDDIYPSITGAVNSKGEPMDEIKSVDEVDESKSTFVVYLHDLEFNLEEHLTTEDAQISMKTGTLQGYTFNMTAIDRLEDGSYKITLGRNSLENSEESGAYVPSKDWNMKAGDKFVLLHILLPQKYIREAENRLLARAQEYLAQYSKTNFSYNIGLHDKFLIQNPSVYDSLIEGSKLKVYDNEIGINEEVTIQSITITENAEDNILPQVKVTLNNEPSASTLDRIQGKLNEVAAETAANGFSTQSELMAQYRKKLDKPFFEKLFVAVDKNGNEIAANDVATPIAYIKAKYHFVSVGGITMYAMDNDVNVPSLASGLPFDNRTIWYNPDTNQIEVIGGTGGGGEGGVSNFWDLSGIPSWITITKPKYTYSEIEGTPDMSKYALVSQIPSLAGYATESWVLGKSYITSATLGTELAKYVTLDTEQQLKGKKDFKNGLSIDGLELRKSQDDVVYIDANLVVRGGVTMYAQNEVDIPSIIDSIPTASTTVKGIASFDGNYFSVDANGKVSLIASNVGLNEEELYNYLTSNNYAKKSDIPSLVGYATQSWVNTRIDSLINGAPAAYDTLKEIADVLQGNVNSIGDIITALGTKWTQDNTKIANWDTAYSWGNHANAGYALKTYVDSELTKYVTLSGEQTISGKKNFTTGGLFVNGSQIIYDSTNKYWKLDGNLVVTGGITMYGASFSGGGAGATTLGQLQNVGNWADSVADVDRIMYQAAGSSNWVAKSLSSIGGGGGVSGDYLPLSGGTITNDTDRYQLCLENNGTGETALWFNNAFNYSKGGAVIQHSKNNKGLYITNFSAYVENNNRLCSLQFPVDGGLKITNASGTIAYDILHANNYSSYALPLSGGTINGNLFIGTPPSSYDSTRKVLSLITPNDDACDLILGANATQYWSISARPTSNVNYAKSLLFHNYVKGEAAMIITTDNNVGIGTIYPKTSLHLSGSNTVTLVANSTSSDETAMAFHLSNVAKAYVGWSKTYGAYLYNSPKGYYLSIKDDGSLYYSGGTIWHSGNFTPSDYLPLTGGMLTSSNQNVLDLKSTSAEITCVRLFRNSELKSQYGYYTSGKYSFFSNETNRSELRIYDDTSIRFTTDYNDTSKLYTIWHSGNDGSGSGLDADLLDGLHKGRFIYHTNTDNPDPNTQDGNWFGMTNQNTPDGNYMHILSSSWTDSIQSGNQYWAVQLALPTVERNGVYIRTGNSGFWNGWYPLITSVNIGSYNAGSATKLQTARTIWGQSFDGTGNVSGDLTSVGNVISSGAFIGRNSSKANESYFGNASFGVNGDGALMYAYGGRNLYFYTNGVERIRVNSSGNVGIGTTNPSYKLDVNGVLRATAARFGGDDGVTIGMTYANSTAGAYDLIERGVSSGTLYMQYNHNGNINMCQGGGSVGIGITNPYHKIHVVGNYDWTAMFEGTNSGVVLGHSDGYGIRAYTKRNSYDYYLLKLSYNQETINSDGSVAMVVKGNGSVGIKNDTPCEVFDVAGNIRTRGLMIHDATNSDHWYYTKIKTVYEQKSPNYLNGAMVFYTMYNSYAAGTEVERMRISSAGNVGIGTASPAYKLDISSSTGDGIPALNVTSKTTNIAWNYLASFLIPSNASGNKSVITLGREHSIGNCAVVYYHNAGNNSSNNYLGIGHYGVNDVLTVSRNGNVGIGTNTPTQPLHIVKSSTSQGDMIEMQSKASWCNIVYSATSGYKWSVGCNTSNQFYFWNNYLSDSAVIFYNNGGILAKGGITMYSDQRKKTILNHVELSLKQIADAPLIEHYYNSDINKTTHVGSIAQYWASMNDWFCKLDNEGYYTMEIQNCALASAISIARELDRYESKTDKTIKQLKKRICQLEEEVERLRAS